MRKKIFNSLLILLFICFSDSLNASQMSNQNYYKSLYNEIKRSKLDFDESKYISPRILAKRKYKKHKVYKHHKHKYSYYKTHNYYKSHKRHRYHNKKLYKTKKKYTKIKRVSKIVPPIKPVKVIPPVVVKYNTPKTSSSMNKVSNNLISKISINQLLKKYKYLIESGKNNTRQKQIYNELKRRFSNPEKFPAYDTIAILNALDDIENKEIGKYEALLTIDNMIEEIK